MAAFWKGLTEAQIGSIMAIVAVVVIQSIVLSWYVTPQHMAQINLSKVPNTIRNQFAYISIFANQLKYIRPKFKSIMMVSTSSGRNSIHNFDQVGLHLSSMTGYPTQFFMLATPNQTLWESGTILESIPSEFDGVVIISIGLHRLSWGYDTLELLQKSPRLAIESPFLFNESILAGIDAQRPSGIFLYDFRNSFWEFGSRVISSFSKGMPNDFHNNPVPGLDENTEKHWKIYYRKLDKAKKSFVENKANNLELLARIIRQLHAKSIPVVLMESTLHPRSYQYLGSEYLQYRQEIEEFATKNAVAYWNFNAEIQFSVTDFKDFSHMSNPQVRQRFQNMLIHHLLVLMQQENDL